MAKYTQRGSDALEACIDMHLEHIAESVSPYCEAVVLLGGYGRGEGTPFILSDGTQTPFNDYDLVVIVDDVAPQVKLQFKILEEQLSADVGIAVDLYPYARNELSSREFSLLNYEMRYGHMVVHGDPHILDAMPAYPHDAIPLSEGSRLLLNRGKLLLDIKRRLSNPEPLSEEQRIRFMKFIFKVWLALGDCALLASGLYDISYAKKKERIAQIIDCPERARIIEDYLNAVELKAWGDYNALTAFDMKIELGKACDLFRHFMPWYRSRYRSRECPVMKAIALNLKWSRRFGMHHPRIQLYDAIVDLLQDKSPLSHERFYELQRRFS